jgi:3,2-trans-enoyl-CoA isomerase
MEFIDISTDSGIATVRINRPKVNALNEQMIDELSGAFRDMSGDTETRAVVLTGEGSFFSFGFDIPELIDYEKDSFHKFVTKFSRLVRDVFIYPKPMAAALNGHTVAGGCILAIACDMRVMAQGKAKIALNELTFGSTVFTSIVEMLRYTVGSANAQKLLYSGKMNAAEEALALGLVDEIRPPEEVPEAAVNLASGLCSLDSDAFKSVKTLLRKTAYERMEAEEERAVSEFVDIWYSEKTRRNLLKIEIRG